MIDFLARKAVWLMLAAFFGLLALPAVARADAPVRANHVVVRDFYFPCEGFDVNAHAISDQTSVSFSDGTFSGRVDEDETFSYGTRYVVVHSRYNLKGAYGVSQSQGMSQLWSADGRLLYTAAGQSTWTITNGSDSTPRWDPNPLWNLVCEQLKP